MGRYLKDGVGELRSGYFSDECRDRNVDGVGGVDVVVDVVVDAVVDALDTLDILDTLWMPLSTHIPT